LRQDLQIFYKNFTHNTGALSAACDASAENPCPTLKNAGALRECSAPVGLCLILEIDTPGAVAAAADAAAFFAAFAHPEDTNSDPEGQNA